MNLLAHEAAELFNEIQFYCAQNKTNCEVSVFPSSLYLAALRGNAKSINIGAQNVSDQLKGAYTGEISVNQLESLGIRHCLVGHSERRSLYGENDDFLNRKVLLLLENNHTPVFCIGETLEQRDANNHFSVIEQQIRNGLSEVPGESFGEVIIAYEPVWAIGTGKTASPDQAQEMHAHIRNLLEELYGHVLASNTSILYGGSVKPSNASELFNKKDVDGALVGGASLVASHFISIIQAFD